MKFCWFQWILWKHSISIKALVLYIRTKRIILISSKAFKPINIRFSAILKWCIVSYYIQFSNHNNITFIISVTAFMVFNKTGFNLIFFLIWYPRTIVSMFYYRMILFDGAKTMGSLIEFSTSYVYPQKEKYDISSLGMRWLCPLNNISVQWIARS